jgi:hypothetical protein
VALRSFRYTVKEVVLAMEVHVKVMAAGEACATADN